MHFTAYGQPVAKGRPRFTRSGRTYTPKATAEAEAVLRARAQAEGCQPLSEPCAVDLTFWLPTRRRVDIDNLQKLVLDALNGVAFTDDVLVHQLTSRVHRACSDVPRTQVHVTSLADGVSCCATAQR